jgi:hypothetical protein
VRAVALVPLLSGCVLITASERDVQALHWVDVGIGGEATCGVRTDGTVRCWGDAALTDWAAAAPTGADFVSVSVGYRHACALRDDGSAACFGNPIVFGDDGHATALPGPYAWLLAGLDKSCAGSDDGTYECVNPPTNWTNDAPTGAVDTLAVWYGACAVERATGALTCWGENGPPPVLPAGVAPVALAMGLDSTLCVLDDDGVARCGSLSYDGGGTLSLASDDLQQIAVVGEEFACGLTTSGAIECFGDQIHDAMADPPGGTWSHLAVGSVVGCAVGADHRLGCWGDRTDPRFPR